MRNAECGMRNQKSPFRMPHSCWRLILGLAVIGVASSPMAQQRPEPVFPGKSWEVRRPEKLGLDAAKLEDFARRIGGDGCLIKDGYLVKTWGSLTATFDWASAMKPVLSTLLFFAVAEGK